MAPTEGRVDGPERWWGCRRGTPDVIRLVDYGRMMMKLVQCCQINVLT